MAQFLPALAMLVPFVFLLFAPVSLEERLGRHRNLGKAFYENPATQKEAVEEFQKALELAPDSARERLNYGLALLRAGRTDEGVAELQKVQKQDPQIPHTWFNLAISYKKAGEAARALAQMEQFSKLVHDDPIAHYNLGALHKLTGNADSAVAEFERASTLDPALAAAHFQLYNSYRTAGRTDEAKKELATFQTLKKQQEGAAIAEDVEWNAFAEILDVMEDARVLPPLSPFSWEEKVLPGTAEGAKIIDASGKGALTVVTWSGEGLRIHPGGVLPGIRDVLSVAPGDFNNDGLTDLCVLTKNGVLLLSNKAGQFVREGTNLPEGRFHQAVWIDYDHDYDLDLILLGSRSILLQNAGSAGFQDRTSAFPFVEGEATAGVSLRVMPDTRGFDLAVSYASRSGVLYRDRLQGKYTAEDLPVPAAVSGLTAADLNNDGYPDLALVNSGQITWLRNRDGAFTPPTGIGTGNGFVLTDLQNRGVLDLVAGNSAMTGDGKGRFAATTAKVTSDCSATDSADLNDDGLPDVVCVGSGTARILTNQTSAVKQHYVKVRLQGVRNLKLAEGAEVEVKAGLHYQKRLYHGQTLILGLGSEQMADTVRISWPNGLIQNEIRQAADKTYSWVEAQRLSGSCPMIWTWDGSGFRYITDVLGVAPLGASSGDGRYFPVDHDEYIQIPADALREKDGTYEVRITEELSEVAYLDQIRLFRIDRPAGISVFTNDKFKSPPFPKFRLFGVSRRIIPVAAVDDQGRDVRERILHRDQNYPDTFRRGLSGVAALHHLDLDFGKASANGEAVLVLNGWVDWADGSTFLAASQENKGGLLPPSLQVKDGRGQWVTVLEDMGMPAGKPKTIAVDLSGRWLSASREVRIVTNLCVYWDEIFLSEQAGESGLRAVPVSTQSAELRFRGFSPARIHPLRLQPEQFTWADPAPQSSWNPTPGFYTRYGDVQDLAESIDDRMIVMGSGDELRLRFDARSQPPVRAGYVREFLLMVDGWAKDRDANTAWSQTTEPLPFHGMSQYPYPSSEAFPDTPAHRQWRKEYLTRPALRLTRPLRPSPSD